jgi:hypothetical protein
MIESASTSKTSVNFYHTTCTTTQKTAIIRKDIFDNRNIIRCSRKNSAWIFLSPCSRRRDKTKQSERGSVGLRNLPSPLDTWYFGVACLLMIPDHQLMISDHQLQQPACRTQVDAADAQVKPPFETSITPGFIHAFNCRSLKTFATCYNTVSGILITLIKIKFH